MDLPAEIGPALRRLREKVGISQEQLARKANLTPAMLSRYERGFRSPHLASLSALLDGLGVDVHDLADALTPAEESSGRPNADWVAMLSGRYVDEARLFGLAYGLLHDGDAQARADFVASFEAVAREAARRAIADVDAGPTPPTK